MKDKLNNLLKQFNINGNLLNYKCFTSGHINSTFLVEVLNNNKINKYVVQKINSNVFSNPFFVMENISKVTNFIKNKNINCLEFFKTNENKYYYKTEENEYWRVYKFIDKSITFNSTDNLKILEETGKAFGEFQASLSNFKISDLHIIIPHFHNTINRYELFEKSIVKNYNNRVDLVKNEIKEYFLLKDIATKMYKMQKNGELNLRVTHNDTKCNNVLFNQNSNNYICVIDLDTVMPGLIGFDYGDAIRFGANSCSEDETNLEKIKLDLNKFEAFTKGFLSFANNSLTKKESETLSLGAITMTIECGLRFLTDFLNGDIYFKTNYENHNLDRSRCQLTLAKDMIKNYKKMQEIVNKYSKNKLQNFNLEKEIL